jgi:two-component SAPR family response regulator
LTYIDLTQPPEEYIWCEEPQGHFSQINVKMCEKRCENAATCMAYQEWQSNKDGIKSA